MSHYKPAMCPSCRIVHKTIQEHLLAHFEPSTEMHKLLTLLAAAVNDGEQFQEIYMSAVEYGHSSFQRGQEDVLNGGYAASQAAAAFRKTWK